jgi:1-acyl-sn-glycerol-3-phosphate acyltransferase
MATRVHPVVRWFATAACHVFYRVDCVGDLPGEGALLLLPNHPNALLDPALIWATADRDVRFLAKSTLFKTPLRLILNAGGAIPVYRRSDEGVDTSKNAETFAAVAAALGDGDAVCLFPEGLSHSKGRLEPLRTGAARMALAAEQNGTSVNLVAVGLNFDRKALFRSRVTVVFGAPFAAHDLAPADDAALAGAVRGLTDRIAAHMRELLIEADPKADAVLVDRVDRLYAAARGRPSDPHERVVRRRTIAAGIQRLRSADPERYGEVMLRLRRYDERLKRFGIRDRHLDWQVTSADATRFAIREVLFGIVLLPLAALGLVAFFIPYQFTAIASRIATRESDVIATAQVVAGTMIYGAWLAALMTVAWLIRGSAGALIVGIATPVLAVAALFAIERESAVIDAVRAWVLLRRASGETRERLRRRRSELADVLDQVHDWMMSAGAATSPVGGEQRQR